MTIISDQQCANTLYVECCSALSNQTPMGDLWYAQGLGSLHTPKACPLISDDTHNRRNFLLSRCCQRHDVVNLRCYSTTWWTHAQRRHAIEQLIVCRRNNSITAAYFDAPFAQGESQGTEKWHRLSFFLLRVVFETAEACKVSVPRDDPNFFIAGDYFSRVRKTFCAQGRHTA